MPGTDGWIKLHRSITEWEWYRNGTTARLFLHLLLTAAHEPGTWHGVEIRPGDVVTSERGISKILDVSHVSISNGFHNLTETGEISLISMVNPYGTVWKINKWSDYQCDAHVLTPNLTPGLTPCLTAVNNNNSFDLNVLDNKKSNEVNSLLNSKNTEQLNTPFHIKEFIQEGNNKINTPAPARTCEMNAGFVPWPRDSGEVLAEATRQGMLWTPGMADSFFCYYSAVGWMLKAGPIRNWRYLLRGWYDNSMSRGLRDPDVLAKNKRQKEKGI